MEEVLKKIDEEIAKYDNNSKDISTCIINANIVTGLLKAKKIIQSKQKTNGWIPVSERLPREGEFVLAVVNHSYKGKYETILCAYTTSFDYWKDGTILAWQLLPEAYKEELR